MKMKQKADQAMKSLLHLNKKIKDSKGFTIIELLIVVLLMVVVVTVVSATFLLSANASKDIIDITTNEIDARVVVYRISKDLREAVNISTANDEEITFKSNVDADEEIELVHYYLQLNDDGYYDLYREIDDGEAKVAATRVIDNNLFTYYTGVNTPEGGMAVPVGEEYKDDIRLIDVHISIDQSGGESNRTMNLDTTIYLRNEI